MRNRFFFWRHSQWRTDYNNAGSFIAEAEQPYAGFIRRRLFWLLPPQVVITITVRQVWPCSNCLTVLKSDLRELFGDIPIKLDPERDVIKFTVRRGDGQEWLLGDDFHEMTDTVRTRLANCSYGVHYKFNLAG